MAVRLVDRDRAMLGGAQGESARLAMEIVVAMAESVGAERLVGIASGHIDGALYHGKVSLDFAERLVAGGGRVRVPTTLNVGSLDLLHPGLYRGDEDTARAGRRLMELYADMGCRPTWTCAPYQMDAVRRAAPGREPAGRDPVPGERSPWPAPRRGRAVPGARAPGWPRVRDAGTGDRWSACRNLRGSAQGPQRGRSFVWLGGAVPRRGRHPRGADSGGRTPRRRSGPNHRGDHGTDRPGARLAKHGNRGRPGRGQRGDAAFLGLRVRATRRPARWSSRGRRGGVLRVNGAERPGRG